MPTEPGFASARCDRMSILFNLKSSTSFLNIQPSSHRGTPNHHHLFAPTNTGMMLPSSVRRVVSAAPQSQLLSNLAPSSSRAPAAAFTLCSNPQSQQRRRYSSSKPSSPSDSPKGIPDGQVTAAPSQSSKQSGEKRKRKVKEWMDIQQKLPSVPSTQHVPQEGSCKLI